MQLRLSQHRVVQGPLRANGTRDAQSLGFRERLDCVTCEQRDPGPDSETKRFLGCRKGGLTHVAAKPIRIDFTGDPTQDEVFFCPGSFRDVSVMSYLYEAIDIERFGGLAACSKQGVYHLPDRVVDFYKAALGARDRFDAELTRARAEVGR